MQEEQLHGKSTLAHKIEEEFKDDVILLAHDFYYKSLTDITLEERKKRNYDCPEAFETDLMIKDIKALINGQTIERPIYSYTERLREDKTVTVKPTSIVIIEGILVLENEELTNLMNLKVFVDTDADIRLTRLVERDRKERGLDLEYIISKYKDTLKPMHEKYVEPCKKKADIIIPANKDNNDTGFDVIINKIRNMIGNKQ